jgi:hypothetical protein
VVLRLRCGPADAEGMRTQTTTARAAVTTSASVSVLRFIRRLKSVPRFVAHTIKA